MRRLALAIIALSMALSGTALAATPCRDAAGKFIKCAPAPVKAKKCRDAKGKFTACMPGAGKGG